jgi:hypothetical protein
VFRVVQDAFDKEEILGKLMCWQSEAELAPKVRKIAELREIPERRVCLYIHDLYKLSLPVEEHRMQSFSARMAQLIKQVCSKSRCGCLICRIHLKSRVAWGCIAARGWSCFVCGLIDARLTVYEPNIAGSVRPQDLMELELETHAEHTARFLIQFVIVPIETIPYLGFFP